MKELSSKQKTALLICAMFVGGVFLVAIAKGINKAEGNIGQGISNAVSSVGNAIASDLKFIGIGLCFLIVGIALLEIAPVLAIIAIIGALIVPVVLYKSEQANLEKHVTVTLTSPTLDGGNNNQNDNQNPDDSSVERNDPGVTAM